MKKLLSILLTSSCSLVSIPSPNLELATFQQALNDKNFNQIETSIEHLIEQKDFSASEITTLDSLLTNNIATFNPSLTKTLLYGTSSLLCGVYAGLSEYINQNTSYSSCNSYLQTFRSRLNVGWACVSLYRGYCCLNEISHYQRKKTLYPKLKNLHSLLQAHT